MEDANNRGKTIWDMLTYERERVAGELEEEQDQVALTALLRVMVLRGAPPPAQVDLLSPENACVVREGALLRGRLPASLVWRRARLDVHFSLLLPPLRALIHGYLELTTEEFWATGLGRLTNAPVTSTPIIL
jgi:hypothetical protein